MTKIGYTWLIERYAIKARPLSHSSFVGPKMLRRERADGTVEEHYIRSYEPGSRALEHLVFALKYDVLDLDIFSKVFGHILPQEIADFVAETPSGRFARQIGFWYEELTGSEVPLNVRVMGNYESLLDPELYVTAPKAIKNVRWRINNNAVGSRRFLPLIRRTPAIRMAEQADWQAMIAETLGAFPQDVLYRALSFLYFKETKSSFAIEHQEPGASRVEKFVAVLHQAGLEQNPLNEEVLTLLQNAIVDERYCEKGFRNHQNYVGQTTAYFQEIIHTVGVPPASLRDLMEGLAAYFHASEGVSPILRATAISFPFVFIHPFEDGNGRLHRYLIHDVLARAQIGGKGVLLPISSEILLNIRLYDNCLEQFSKPLVAVAEYSLTEAGVLTVHNPGEIEGFYRYPDLTAQCEFLAQMLERTIRQAIPQEIHFLQKFDQARTAITEIVDMPDRKREQLLMRLSKNGGKLAQKRREREFSELTNREIAGIEEAYRDAFMDGS
ncbi:MAG: Fic family protein [Terrimicrobiaceae bacterium]